VHKDPAAKTMAITSSFEAPIERVWQLWADPRQLERWWGPPTYPATMVDHDLSPGGVVTYYMTSPEGERYHGWWRLLAVEEPRLLEFEDGFGESPSAPVPDLPVSTMRVELTALAGGGTRMEIRSTFPSVEAMEQLIEMGQEEGMVAALGQIDDLLGVKVRD
jgi:uncharacterized protein YndB with AHSA1/START domain